MIGSGLLTNRDGAGVPITSLGWVEVQKATGLGNRGHSPRSRDMTATPFVRTSPILAASSPPPELIRCQKELARGLEFQ